MRIGDGNGAIVAAKAGYIGLADSSCECTARQYFNGCQTDKAGDGICIADKYLIAARGQAGKVTRSLPVDAIDAVFVSA